MKVRVETVYSMLKNLYPKFIRPILHSAVDDPEKEWDDVMMSIIDRFFLYDVED